MKSNRSNRIPELPSLSDGVYLLESESVRGPLHTLVLDHILTTRGPAYWIDTHGHATTQPLARLAPDPQVLDRIRVARGFTAFQHYALIETLSTVADGTASMIVCPAIDGLYRDESLRDDERQEMLVRILAMLSGMARNHDLPVVLTRTREDMFAGPIANAAGDIIECEQTRLGPRFHSDGFETLVYPLGNGQLQTTLAFWARILEARQPVYDAAQVGPQSPEVPADGSY
jgi:Rad51